MEISLKTLLDWVIKGIVLILVLTIIGGAGAFLYTKYMITPTYRSSVKLCADPGEITVQQEIPGSIARAPQYIEVLRTTEFYQMVADELLRSTHNIYTAGEIGGTISFSSPVADTGVFAVSVTTSDPQLSYDIALAITAAAPTRINNLYSSDSLMIVSYPSKAGSPFAPSISKNTALGLFIGLALSLAIIVIRELLDNRVRSVEEITENYALPILGSVPSITTGVDAKEKK